MYFPLKKEIIKYIKRYPVESTQNIVTLEMSLNIDALPVFSSSLKSVWPILCALHVQPQNFDFLQDTVLDLQDLLQHGLQHNNRTLQVRIRNIACDAPARAFVKAVKQYYGCDRCTAKGGWL